MHRRKLYGGILVVAVGWAAGSTAAQGQTELFHATGPLPSFEVAAIKVNDGLPPMIGSPGIQNIFRADITAKGLIMQAYRAPATGAERVLGGPGWIDKTRFRVEGKIPDALF